MSTARQLVLYPPALAAWAILRAGLAASDAIGIIERYAGKRGWLPSDSDRGAR